ncbi:hypothetical protein TSOC_014157 [Tetrabaena socialis]|uniref:phytol kinase n=1 Tax=Tetrabaena socialis TaxID=47790 RepID=A0A2J7ZIG4_9CHLO|nr:hypothetical protein TSOC_014157 [Tetrabaena socialis]|eukprot:PNH00040.1 hypothetical protein TSOC_014157 [Tetrabaena socialis]
MDALPACSALLAAGRAEPWRLTPARRDALVRLVSSAMVAAVGLHMRGAELERAEKEQGAAAAAAAAAFAASAAAVDASDSGGEDDFFDDDEGADEEDGEGEAATQAAQYGGGRAFSRRACALLSSVADSRIAEHVARELLLAPDRANAAAVLGTFLAQLCDALSALGALESTHSGGEAACAACANVRSARAILSGPCLQYALAAHLVAQLAAADGGGVYGLRRAELLPPYTGFREVDEWGGAGGGGGRRRQARFLQGGGPMAAMRLWAGGMQAAERVPLVALSRRAVHALSMRLLRVAARSEAEHAVARQREQRHQQAQGPGSGAGAGAGSGSGSRGGGGPGGTGDATAPPLYVPLYVQLCVPLHPDAGQLVYDALPCGGLPPSPPPNLAAALSAGYLPLLERTLRVRVSASPCCGHGTAALVLSTLSSWPLLGRLLAYGEPAQAAALLATGAKLVRMLMPPEGEGGGCARGSGGCGSCGAGRLPLSAAATDFLRLEQAKKLPLAAMLECLASYAAVQPQPAAAVRQLAPPVPGPVPGWDGGGGGGSGDAAAAADGGARSDVVQWAPGPSRQLLHLLHGAAHQWLPAAARAATAMLDASTAAGQRAAQLQAACTVLHWVPLLAEACRQARRAAAAAAASEAEAEGQAALPGGSRGAESAADAAVGGGGGGSGGDGAAAAAAAVAGRWRQLLLEDVAVFELLGAALPVIQCALAAVAASAAAQTVAAAQAATAAVAAGGPRGQHMFDIQCCEPQTEPALRAVRGALAALELAFPDEAAAAVCNGALAAPARHWRAGEGMFSALDALWSSVGGHGGASGESMSGVLGRLMQQGLGGGGALRSIEAALGPVPGEEGGEGGVEEEDVYVAYAGGLVSARQLGAVLLAAGAPPPGWPAPHTCSNPRCISLQGDSEAGLQLLACGGCGGAVRYCGAPFQRAHWAAGHKRTCRRRGVGARRG